MAAPLSGRAPLGSGGVPPVMVVGGTGGLALRDLRNGVWKMSDVFVTVDGSCLGNPGPGGWACILRYGEEERVLRGGVAQTTNNRMEMMAAIEGLRARWAGPAMSKSPPIRIIFVGG